MSFKKIVTSKNFWPSVFLFAGIFIVFFNIIRVAIEFKFDFGQYFGFHLAADHLLNFIVSNMVGGLIYGFVIIYFRYRRYYKEEK